MKTKTTGNPTRDAAQGAARLYLEARKDRSLKQCIAIAAKENGAEWVSVASYLSGVGARNLLEGYDAQDTQDALMLCKSVLERIAECDDDIVDIMSYEGVTPYRLCAGLIWDAVEALRLVNALIEADE